jgi:hypothetical protein
LTGDGAVYQRIIGFGGPIGSGKNTAAGLATDLLYKFGRKSPQATCPLVVEGAFANEVKKIATEQFGWDGVKDAKGRRLLQVIGTEAGREYNPDIWVDKLIRNLWRMDDDAIVIITDCRFPNEVDFVNRHGISVLLTDRTTTNEGIIGHASETGITACDWRVIMSNGGTIADLQESVNLLLVTWNFMPGADNVIAI